jgi:hypothetical protein
MKRGGNHVIASMVDMTTARISSVGQQGAMCNKTLWGLFGGFGTPLQLSQDCLTLEFT